uniref:Uncharacterized protein n=1 Tax=Timema poppense TaxID=170557 RepID=A0A7R9CN53_TIMPO|nr:unnamed protein product [Timema poppensis]
MEIKKNKKVYWYRRITIEKFGSAQLMRSKPSQFTFHRTTEPDSSADTKRLSEELSVVRSVMAFLFCPSYELVVLLNAPSGLEKRSHSDTAKLGHTFKLFLLGYLKGKLDLSIHLGTAGRVAAATNRLYLPTPYFSKMKLSSQRSLDKIFDLHKWSQCNRASLLLDEGVRDTLHTVHRTYENYRGAPTHDQAQKPRVLGQLVRIVGVPQHLTRVVQHQVEEWVIPEAVTTAKMKQNMTREYKTTPVQDSNPDLPVIGSIVCCESNALEHVATEAGTNMKMYPYPLSTPAASRPPANFTLMLFSKYLERSRILSLRLRSSFCSPPPICTAAISSEIHP